jgi:hypothetical protein
MFQVWAIVPLRRHGVSSDSRQYLEHREPIQVEFVPYSKVTSMTSFLRTPLRDMPRAFRHFVRRTLGSRFDSLDGLMESQRLPQDRDVYFFL